MYVLPFILFERLEFVIIEETIRSRPQNQSFAFESIIIVFI